MRATHEVLAARRIDSTPSAPVAAAWPLSPTARSRRAARRP